ncbi:MAG: hypothetical protein IKM00_03695 [Clostridia bacterium]|nr:hypothetical protein [Clostridia bacterium]
MARPKGIPFTEENAGANYAEFAVARKPDGKIRTQRFLFILTYLAFALAYCFVFLVLVKMGPVIAILPLFLLIMWFFTWKLTKIEYMYIVTQGYLHVYQYNGYNNAKEVLKANLSENEGVYPAGDADYAAFAKECEETLDYSAGKNTDDLYSAVFRINGKKTAVYFTASAKVLTGMRYFGGEKVVVTYVSR